MAELLAGPNARHVRLSVIYKGKDISTDVWPFVTSFRYVDRTVKDKMDDISISFQDVAALWRNAWFPDLGAKFQATIQTRNWFKPGDELERKCGSFEIDDLSSNGPPSVFTISAVAVGITASIRRQENTKAWENVTVKAIAEEIAKKHGFALKWYSNYNPTLDRMDQKSKSDLAFLQEVADYAGLMLKITDSAIVVFRGEEFDGKDPVLTIKEGQDGLAGWGFNANSADVYSACEVKYYDAKKKELVSYLYKPDGISGTRAKKDKKKKSGTGGGEKIDETTRMVIKPASTGKADSEKNQMKEPDIGQVLKVNRRCSSLAEAEQVARAALRNSNMRQIRGTLEFMGHPILYSGANILVDGFGRWDSATWQVETVTHDYNKSGGYVTTAEIRGVLGY